MVQCIQTGDLFAAKSPKIDCENTRKTTQNEASLLKKIDTHYVPKFKVIMKVKYYFKLKYVQESIVTEEERLTCSTLITEYCPGHDLLTAITDQIVQLSERIIQNIIAQLLEALGFIHQQKIIHLDVNYNNIMISDTLSVR